MNGITRCNLLCPTSSHQPPVCGMRSHWDVCPRFISFYCCVACPWMDIPPAVWPFSCGHWSRFPFGTIINKGRSEPELREITNSLSIFKDTLATPFSSPCVLSARGLNFAEGRQPGAQLVLGRCAPFQHCSSGGPAGVRTALFSGFTTRTSWVDHQRARGEASETSPAADTGAAPADTTPS